MTTKASLTCKPRHGEPVEPRHGEPVEPRHGEPAEPRHGEPAKPRHGEPVEPPHSHCLSPQPKGWGCLISYMIDGRPLNKPQLFRLGIPRGHRDHHPWASEPWRS